MTEPLVISTPQDMHAWRRQIGSDASIGFVPTMGALHEGHCHLMERARRDNEFVVASIFVNPTQFNIAEDFENYPRTMAEDVDMASTAGVSVIFAPSSADMYPDGYATYITPCQAAGPLEGERRPGHFRGVVTIVNKLLNCVQPTVAYFGKKDFQQLVVIQGMVSELNMDIRVVGVDTVREPDGLAMSSRNRRLSPADRAAATVIHRALMNAQDLFASGERETATLETTTWETLSSEARCQVEYATVCDARTFERSETVRDDSVLCVACNFGHVRLIDNVELRP